MKTTKITLTRGDEKKHSVVYSNKDQGISGFYVPRELLGEDPPARIIITIEAADGN